MLGEEPIWRAAAACHEALAEAGAPHAVIGGVAVCLHGYRRNTVDVDLLVRPEDTPLIRDALTAAGFASNHAGGVLGGISTGQDLLVRLAIKPTSSIRQSKRSVDRSGEPTVVETHGRHDPCVGIRAAPIAEAMLALVVMDHALRHRAQCADVALPVPPLPAGRG